MDPLDLSQFLGIAGAGAILNVLVEAVKRAAQWDQSTTERIAPGLSVVLGIVIFLLYQVVSPSVDQTAGQGAILAIFTGIIAGGTSAGIYQIAGKSVIRSVAGTPAEEAQP